MLNRALFGAALAVGGAGLLLDEVALFFGRCDEQAWCAAHPPPSPPTVDESVKVRVVDTRRIVPSNGLPSDLTVQAANNNLDVTRFGEFTYLAFRSAPSHFAGADTVLHVVKSRDEQSWESVGRFALGRDLREPRFLTVGERLFLYASVLGDDPFDFVPEGVRASELGSDGRFGPLESIDLPGRIAWRTRSIDGTAYMTAYAGGENLYSLGRKPMEVEFLRTDDGRHFRAVDPARRVVSRGGGSETDFGFAADGSLFAVVRNEAGDDSGFGSKLCRAPSDRLGDWTCQSDPKKYDSPNVFSHQGALFVFGRRQLANDGRYDVSNGPALWRMIRNQLAYIPEAKRCALWRVADGGTRLSYVLDLPSRGDTCFTAVLPGDSPNSVVVYDYSSDIEGPDVPWTVGQRRPTYVYRHVLEFSDGR